MGIPGLLKEIGKGERVALAKLAIDHFTQHKRPLRIAIDAAIWNFQTQVGGQGGKNPALRTLFFRLLRLLALPIHPVFVYDGKNKPLTKRGKTVSRYGTCVPNELSKNLVARFQFPHHTAPGEAEAECATLQKHGIVDAVMSQDVDAIMFGSTVTLRDWSKEGTKGNKAPTHVTVLDTVKIEEASGLDQAGMVLVALLSGGDYHEGVPGFGPALSCSVARAGFGHDLIELVRNSDEQGLREWRERLQYELETNESGYFAKRHKTVDVPEDFPNRTILGYYLDPAVSSQEDTKKLETRWLQWWDQEIDIPALRDYCGMTFDWLYKGGATKFVRCLAQPLFQHHLRTKQINESEYSLKVLGDKRQHFIMDGVAELRFSAIPADVVGLDIDSEEENPEFAELEDEAGDHDGDGEEVGAGASSQESSCPTKKLLRPPWDPLATERWWVPMPLLEWVGEQGKVRACQVKSTTRQGRQQTKTTSRTIKKIDQSMKHGALKEYLPVAHSSCLSSTENAKDNAQPQKTTPRKKKTIERTKSYPVSAVAISASEIESYFRPTKAVPQTRADTSVNTKQSLVSSLLGDVDSMLQNPRMPHTRRPLSRTQTMPAVLNSNVNLNEDEDEEFEWPVGVTQHKQTSRQYGLNADRLAKAPTQLEAPPQPSLSSSVMQESTKSVTEDDEEVIFVGSKQVLPSIESFFLNHSNPESGLIYFDTQAITGHDHEARVSRPEEDAEPRGTSHNLEQHKGRLYDFDRGKISACEAHIASKRFAASRDSLPGAWKEVDLTPSRTSKITFIDLT
ncbi:hypothetical protein LTR05_003244 [Lithohypha guttulata]|uniref:XPG-I domain-containing protein n=1 Tax=Lithohypha guttulata TaxID=1690604 RepID=A0AAN7Y8X1_9EURO|nr:hypothetical protein LTR05_003244 [Lithohypha guttulata]